MPGTVLSVNVAAPHPVAWDNRGMPTAIDKRAAAGRVRVETLRLAGDRVGDPSRHGGADQAVYVYAREDAAWWATELGRVVTPGSFGENLSTQDIDLTGAVIGEVWMVGTAVLQVSCPRVPCHTFAGFWGVPDLVKRFTARATPGTYVRVLSEGEGEVGAGDRIEVANRPNHGVTVGVAFRALTTEPDLLPLLVDLPDLAEKYRTTAQRRVAIRQT
jgi:MOSC domain-containing protein YiiM